MLLLHAGKMGYCSHVYNRCGCEFLSPLDWWSLGTLMFEMSTGAVSVLHYCTHMFLIVSVVSFSGYVTIYTVCLCISECV